MSAGRAVYLNDAALAGVVAFFVVESHPSGAALWKRFDPCRLLAKLILLDRV